MLDLLPLLVLINFVFQLFHRGCLLRVEGGCVHEEVALIAVVQLEIGVMDHISKTTLLCSNTISSHSEGTLWPLLLSS